LPARTRQQLLQQTLPQQTLQQTSRHAIVLEVITHWAVVGACEKGL